MVDFSSYKHTDSKETFFFFKDEDIEKYDINIIDLMPKIRFFDKISKKFNVSFEKLYDVTFNVLHINLKNFLTYSTIQYNSLKLIKENGLYTEKYDKYAKRTVRTYHNVYLYECSYSSTEFYIIAMGILKEQFPHIFNNDLFNDKKRKYPKNLNIKPYNRLIEFDFFEYRDLTFGDIANLLNNPNEINKIELVSRFSLFNDSEYIYLYLGDIKLYNKKYKYHLSIPLKSLYEKDFSLVENCDVYSIILPTANEHLGKDKNNWFDGKQKDAPYWDIYYEQYIKPLKELIEK